MVVGLPTGVVPAPRPILDERWSLARAFSATPGSLAVAGGVLLAVLLVLGWLLGMTGRDRRPGGAPAPVVGAVMESAPPEGIRPAQAGLLVDEVVNPVALSATLVDLAVRGYLRIEELAYHPGRGRDWRLVQLKAPDEGLLGYERMLLDGLAASRRAEDVEAVRLSDLKEQFQYQFAGVRGWLYQDAVQRRWFTDQPDMVRRRWVARGQAVTVVGAALRRPAPLADPLWAGGDPDSAGRARPHRRRQVDALSHACGCRATAPGHRLSGLSGDGRGRPRRPCPGRGPVLPLPALCHRVRPQRAVDPDL